VLKVDGGTASEEKILCSSLSGVTVTVASGGRGWDNTTAASHGTGTSNVEHCFTAAEADDANDHTYTTSRDDHTQYARTDGSRAITGAQIFDSTIQVVGTATCDGALVVSGNETVAGSVTAASFVQSSGTPIGGIVSHATGPTAQTDCTSTTLFTTTAAVVSGQKYMVSLYAFGTQITAPGTIVYVHVTNDDSWPTTPTSTRCFSGQVPQNTETAGGASWQYVASATRTTTFTVAGVANAGALRVQANNVELDVVRIA
jgi:hypothetical protein